jgi:hypothetical protein
MTTFKTKSIVMEPQQKRKYGVAQKMAQAFSNPDIGRAMADDQFRDQGGKMHRVRNEKLWARTRF